MILPYKTDRMLSSGHFNKWLCKVIVAAIKCLMMMMISVLTAQSSVLIIMYFVCL